MILAILTGVSLLGFGGRGVFSGHAGSSRSTRDIALSCTLDMYTQFHIHPHLRIIVNGAEAAVPANIGVSVACLHPVHTHDTTGTIHVESPERRDFTLADFFAVWDKPFSKDQILDSKADATHEIIMTVNGKSNERFENLVLSDKDEIVIEYKKK